HSDKDLEDILTRVSGIDLNHLLLKPVSPTSLYDHIVTLFEKKLMDSESEANPLKGSRILVVDDNDFNLQIACEILERAGIIAEAVSEGIKAVELIKNSIKLHTPYDAVLMDIQMPNMSGLDATQIIRQWEQQYSEHKAIPIIALSANAMVDDADKSLASGMNEHLSKPINPNKLLKSLRQWIEIHSKQDQDIDLNSN
ncbi:MAG: response regulator, partial [Gammaproteobacteria bacterium]|nr:response regulator [Gammaproteobacteria bacterium]